MKFTKKIVGFLEKCYSIAPMVQNGQFHFLIAAEKRDPCYLFDESGTMLETVWTKPGGVMTMVQVPGAQNQFLATHQFYSPNDSAEAKIVIATRKEKDEWEIRTLADVPFIHRFGILERNGIHYLLVCCLKSGHDFKDDWTKPGRVFAAELPEDLSAYDDSNQLSLTLVKDQMGHNHGYSSYSDHGVDTAVITCDEGVFQFVPPERRGSSWSVHHLYDQPVSDAVLCDFDGDGQPELGCISPFHGDQLYVCHKNKDGNYEKVWGFPEPSEMLHATWACKLLGKPAWIVGHRKGKRNLMVVTYENDYKTSVVDPDCGPANAFKFVNQDGEDVIVTTNREINEIAMYTVSD